MLHWSPYLCLNHTAVGSALFFPLFSHLILMFTQKMNLASHYFYTYCCRSLVSTSSKFDLLIFPISISNDASNNISLLTPFPSGLCCLMFLALFLLLWFLFLYPSNQQLLQEAHSILLFHCLLKNKL